jgi:hypothetical protein
VVLSGDFTPAQRNIVKTRCSIDVNEFNSIFSWLRTNNPIFAKMESSENCATPIILDDDTGIDEESEDGHLQSFSQYHQGRNEASK